ncbi:MAG: hypothetical protein VX899_08255 [Myxococcota bacterium]|nr:hypothetical protein [Myxococcota bacterium]
MILLLLACSSPPECDTGTPTWDGEVRDLLITHCQACHAEDTPNRYGAPEGSSFDTEADAIAWADRIRVRVVEDQTMPPGGGMEADEIAAVEAWLDCVALTQE